MLNKRGKKHTTLTETASEVVKIVKKIPGINMVAPGIISKNQRRGSGQRYVTIVKTNAGLQLIISGQGTQKVAVHCENKDVDRVISSITEHRDLSHIIFKLRERRPGV